MTSYRRRRVPGGTCFFIVNLAERGSTLLVDHVDLLRSAWAQSLAERPVVSLAVVILPDHLHAVWRLPPDDWDFSTRWGAIKSRFSRRVRDRLGRPPMRRNRTQAESGDAGIWQRRFLDHQVRDDADLAMHLRYCWQNPVRHGLVARPADWILGSLHRDIRMGRATEEGEVAFGQGPVRPVERREAAAA